MKLELPKTTSIENAILCGRWGSKSIPIYHVKTVAALNHLVGYVKFINGTNGTVLYRGQGKDMARSPQAVAEKNTLLYLMKQYHLPHLMNL